MEMGLMKYISFKDYKEKIKQNITTSQKAKNLTNEQIMTEMDAVVKAYERKNGKAGGKIGNI